MLTHIADNIIPMTLFAEKFEYTININDNSIFDELHYRKQTEEFGINSTQMIAWATNEYCNRNKMLNALTKKIANAGPLAYERYREHDTFAYVIVKYILLKIVKHRMKVFGKKTITIDENLVGNVAYNIYITRYLQNRIFIEKLLASTPIFCVTDQVLEEFEMLEKTTHTFMGFTKARSL